MTNKDRVLGFLWSIAPTDASNVDIGARTGIRSHQQIFGITRNLMHAGEIRGFRAGRDWRFYCGPARSRIPTTLPQPEMPTLLGRANVSQPEKPDFSPDELAHSDRIRQKVHALRQLLSDNAVVDR
jgi:hypothetical protein